MKDKFVATKRKRKQKRFVKKKVLFVFSLRSDKTNSKHAKTFFYDFHLNCPIPKK